MSSHISPTQPDTTFYVTSDLHYGVSKRGDHSTHALADYVLAHPADALFVVGDIGKDPQTLHDCLALFRDFPGKKCAVPGNHDIWLHGWPSQDSWQIHEEGIPEVMRDAGFHPLHLAPLQVGPLGFVGSMGWYDYSFRDDIGIALNHYQTKTPPWSTRPLWNDANYANFPVDDPTLTAQLTQRLRSHLTQLPDATEIIAMIHHVVTKALLIHPRERVPEMWRFANTFLGSEQLGQALIKEPRVRQAFCGHIHMSRKSQLQQCACTCIGSDYKTKQLLLADASSILDVHDFESPRTT